MIPRRSNSSKLRLKLRIMRRNTLKLLTLDESPPECPPSAPPPWTELPADVTANILLRLGTVEILQSAQLVCTAWWKVCQDPSMYRIIKTECPHLDYEAQARCNILCRRAVDRSQGQLVELHTTNCCSDELLDYIANRSTHLRRLTFDSNDSVSGTAVVEAVKMLPELEELRLFCQTTLAPADIESIAESCPSLMTLSLFLLGTSQSNDHAVEISKFMPRLKRLDLIDFAIDSIGVEAILDGCRHLEILHLDVYDVDLSEALGKRGRDQIKDFQITQNGRIDVESLAASVKEMASTGIVSFQKSDSSFF